MNARSPVAEPVARIRRLLAVLDVVGPLAQIAVLRSLRDACAELVANDIDEPVMTYAVLTDPDDAVATIQVRLGREGVIYDALDADGQHVGTECVAPDDLFARLSPLPA